MISEDKRLSIENRFVFIISTEFESRFFGESVLRKVIFCLEGADLEFLRNLFVRRGLVGERFGIYFVTISKQ